jgi:hypothetical protein
MTLHSAIKVIAVWSTYIFAWIVDLVLVNFLDWIILLKELFALIGFIIAAGYTTYKFTKDWNGWNPRKKKK